MDKKTHTQSDPPAPLIPEHVLDVIRRVGAPCVVYDLPSFERSVRRMVRAFDACFFPVKCNPHPEMLKAAAGRRAGLDVCSPQEFEMARKTGIPGARISHTGVALEPGLMTRMAAAGAWVNLDSIQELDQWLSRLPGRPVSLRLKAGRDFYYLNKFGIGVRELPAALEKIRAAKARLAGVHVHFEHEGQTPGDLAREYLPFLETLSTHLGDAMGGLERVNLGGGWPAFGKKRENMTPDRIAGAFETRVAGPLKAAGFAGEIAVEPGAFAASGCGYWAAEAAVLKPGAKGGVVAVLNTAAPVPSPGLPYPVAVLRGKGADMAPVSGKASVFHTLTGLTNSPLDVIRESVALPGLRPGDTVVFCRTGAYLATSMSALHGRPAPPVHVAR